MIDPSPTSSPTEMADRLRHLNRIGIALSNEKDLSRLLERILLEARRITRAEAGTLYIRRGDRLEFEISQNEVLESRDETPSPSPAQNASSTRMFAASSLPLSDTSLAGHVARTRRIVNIPDVSSIPPEAPYRFNDSFDRTTGFRTRSMLLVPMVDLEDHLLGVVQIINARDEAGQTVPFLPELEEIAHSLASQAAVSIHNARLLRRLKDSHLDTIIRLAMAAEYRDGDTATHIRRMSLYSERLARELDLEEDRVEMIRYASPLHDLGKIGIRDSILCKPEKLTDAEYDEMKRHTEIAGHILRDSPAEILRLAETIALTHHERWDGTGYPRGLRGEEIPLEGRIVAVADVYDALTSPRVYKRAFPIEEALALIRSSTGSHFDPSVVQALERCLDDFEAIQREHSNP